MTDLCFANWLHSCIWGYTWWQDSRTNQQVAGLEENFRVRQEQRKAEVIEQKKARLAQVAKMKQQLVAENLSKAQTDLTNLPPRMTWEKIKQRYPDFEKRSLFLKELAEIEEKILNKKDNQTQKLSTKLEKFAAPSEAEQHLLSQLRLTEEQFCAIAGQAKSLTTPEKEVLRKVFAQLSPPIKLNLVNAGLNNCGVDTYEKKLNLLNLNHRLHEEKKHFQPSIEQKEAILRLLINRLEISLETRNSLEEIGVSFFDASNWQVQEEQKNNLLRFGLSKLQLTEEQNQNLLNLAYPEGFQTFVFHEEQDSILRVLAPLIQEYKHSSAAKELINALQLKTSHLNFFVKEGIFPNPHTDFGPVPEAYWLLRTKFLLGEQKLLRQQEKARLKTEREEEIQARKQLIIQSLGHFAEEKLKAKQSLNISLSLED
ncbi:4112_t:CDS:2 [Racocetra persica]|uniref:4112_t:CDS:1 n=1 Tax=Racocetra persica TaxID=160502 RepID=A0ACA9KKS0_9GLOM|nr:4112_t:CDS:2 [Racocetra persica]